MAGALLPSWRAAALSSGEEDCALPLGPSRRPPPKRQRQLLWLSVGWRGWRRAPGIRGDPVGGASRIQGVLLLLEEPPPSATSSRAVAGVSRSSVVCRGFRRGRAGPTVAPPQMWWAGR